MLSKLASFFAVIGVLQCLGCSTPRGGGIGPGYLVQAALGQLQISSRARPISQVLRDGRVDGRTRRALEMVSEVKAFGESQGLKATRNYEEFSELKRPAVVWVVSASEPLRFEAARWSFPVVGSFSYLGWFSRENGESFRQRLEASGYDSDLRPASAYSTLGWFRDPLLSTMLPEDGDPGDLIEVVLHESVHATVHIKGQSTLNESLAQFLGEKLAEKFMSGRGEVAKLHLSAYLKSQQEQKTRQSKMRAAYLELELLYRSDRADAEKASEKARILAHLRQQIQWPVARTLNNATLVQFSTYQSSPQGWEELWSACGESASRMIESVLGWWKENSRAHSEKELEARELDDALSMMRTRCR